MTVHQTIAALGVACGLTFAASGAAGAAESITPLQPGASTGIPNAALPPPGVYFSFDSDYAWGTMRNNSGDVSHLPADSNPDVKASNFEAVGALMWVPGWKLLGADYAAVIAQPVKFAHTTISDPLAAADWHANGFVGTVISPVILSWALGNGWFVGGGLAIATPDGTTGRTWNAMLGKYTLSQSNIANYYWTFEPNFAVTWMKDGWMVSVNNVLDFNTKNTNTDYWTAPIYYLDATVAKRFGKWNVGVVGNYTQQLANDQQFGKDVANSIAQHIKIGPMVSYDFDRFTLSARYLGAVYTRNDVGVSFVHVGFSMKLL
ncbi:MAG: hypothetical protein GX458_17985 [Phyllobacteriaceae bacterium]|nr:hypothetical protein [Phyllobacteriaceae bacterium]